MTLPYISAHLLIISEMSSFLPYAASRGELNPNGLNWDFASWNFSKHPKIKFIVGPDSKVKDLVVIKNKSSTNASECTRAVVASEPFTSKYKGELIEFTCRPLIEITDKEAKQIQKSQIRYITNIQNKIRSNWHPLKSNESYSIIAVFNIDQGGNLYDLKLKVPHKDENGNLMARKAIELSTPFPKPDPEVMQNTTKLNIEFTFDYSIYKQNVSYANHPARSALLGGLIAIGTGLGLAEALTSPSYYYSRPYYRTTYYYKKPAYKVKRHSTKHCKRR